MKALKVNVNGEQFVAGIEDGVTTVVITMKKTSNSEKIQLDVSGLDKKESDETQFTYQYWANNELKENDKISIEVIETDEISSPQSSKKIPKSEIENRFEEEK